MTHCLEATACVLINDMISDNKTKGLLDITRWHTAVVNIIFMVITHTLQLLIK
jgi:hypothetical protein